MLAPKCEAQTCCQQMVQSSFGLEMPEDRYLLQAKRATSQQDAEREKAAKADFKQGQKNRIKAVKEIINKVNLWPICA